MIHAGGRLAEGWPGTPAPSSARVVRTLVCHATNVPSVGSLDALYRAVTEFDVTDPDLVIEPGALGGDGRITAGHLAVLAERAAADPLELILFDGVTGADWSWSQRDEAMARRIL